MPENPAPFAAMPGFEGLAPMGVPGQMGVPDFGQQDEEFKRQQREQEEAARKQQADVMLKEFVQSRGLAAQEALGEAERSRGQSRVGLKVKTNDAGVSGLGGSLSIPLSQRIGFTVGGGYATPQSQTQQVMGRDMQFDAPGQFTGTVGYRSPFINIDVEHSPSKGFGASAGGRATW